VYQVGPTDSGSQIFSFLALKAEAGEVQILRTATARDRQIFLLLKLCYLFIKSKKNKTAISLFIFLDTKPIRPELGKNPKTRTFLLGFWVFWVFPYVFGFLGDGFLGY
jgi:hypothetical protein